CSNIAKLAQDAKAIISLPKLKCFFLKVLPKMYDDSDVVGLTFLSVCDHHQLASAAVLLLQLLLLKKESSKPPQRMNELIVAEGLLWGKLFTLRKNVVDGRFESFTLFSRLAVAYVMVLCDFVLTCIKENNMFKGDTHLDTIEGRSLYPAQLEDEAVRDVCKWFDDFVKDMVQRKCKNYKEMLHKLEIQQDQLSGTDEAECIASQPPTIQNLVAYQAVKKIFHSMSGDDLEILTHYMCTRKNVSDASSEIIFQGLALFVVFQLKREAFVDVETFCSTAIEILKCKLPPQTVKIKKGAKVDPLLQMLFFNPNPSIRAATMISTTMKSNKTKDIPKQLFSVNREIFILNEVLRVLYPLLTETEKVDDKDKQSGKDWLLYKGKFGDMEARVHLHLPQPQDLQVKLKTTFAEEDVFYNEMMMLGKVQHESIIQMYAFQRQYIPQFYILEHHSDLQSALKNMTQNQGFAKKPKLVGYLVQALKAVVFCHSKSIVHRNLTAKSLLMVDENNVKLSGFHLSLEMTHGEAIAKAGTNSMIPTRWSAPESLKDNRYSAASDVWMFGHLMYEVLTHGGLPYADMEEESELTEKIKKGDIHLSEHRLIQRGHYDIITRCTEVCLQDRPGWTGIKMALEKREGGTESMDTLKMDNIDVDDFKDGHKPSTDHGKGIPTTSNSIFREDMTGFRKVTHQGFISDTVTKITDNHVHQFIEKLVNMDSGVRIQLRNGVLTNLLPYISIKESPKEMPHAECIIPLLQVKDTEELSSQETVMSYVDTSLEKAALDKLLGESVKPYLECLYQVASLLEKLHSELWMIGDMSMPLIHVQWKSQDGALSVYIVSIAYLQKYNPEDDNEEFSDMDASTTQPKDPLLMSRAAPEVAEFGMFSQGSDVYCFGNLMWQTLKALDCPSDMKTAYLKEQMENANFKQTKVSEKWETSHVKPRNCSPDLYDLMRGCTQHSSSARIPAYQLVQQLRRIIEKM
ncbi:tyrosine-protein kinase, partial [Elysia marginata]